MFTCANGDANVFSAQWNPDGTVKSNLGASECSMTVDAVEPGPSAGYLRVYGHFSAAAAPPSGFPTDVKGTFLADFAIAPGRFVPAAARCSLPSRAAPRVAAALRFRRAFPMAAPLGPVPMSGRAMATENMNAPRYRSETRSTSIGELPTDLRAALVSYAENRKLKLILASFWQTHCENPVASTLLGKLLGKRANPSDPDAFHDMVLVVHASHLLLATSGRSRGTTVFSVPLLLATLTRGGLGATRRDGAFGRADDDGMNIGGFSEDNGASGTGFMGLGAGPAAEACVLAATAAIADAVSAAQPG